MTYRCAVCATVRKDHGLWDDPSPGLFVKTAHGGNDEVWLCSEHAHMAQVDDYGRRWFKERGQLELTEVSK